MKSEKQNFIAVKKPLLDQVTANYCGARDIYYLR